MEYILWALFFNSAINKLLNKHAPLKRAVSKKDPIPWFDSNAESVIVCRDLAYRTWRANKTDSNWKNFTILRNKAVSIVRNAHKLFSTQLLDPSLDGKTLFKNMGKLGITRSSPVETSANDFSSEQFNNFFSLSQKHSGPLRSSYVPQHHGQVDNRFSFTNITQFDTLNAFKSIKSNSTGSDNIPPKSLKVILPYILPHIRYFPC